MEWMTWWNEHFRSRFGGGAAGLRTPDEAKWKRIAGLAVAGACGLNTVNIDPDQIFRKIKLRPMATDLDVCRWTMEFNDGSILDLSLPRLLEGTESKPVSITGRQLKRVMVKYDPDRVTRRGRLEIWAQA